MADGDRRAAVLIEAVLGLAGFDDVAPIAGNEGVPSALVRGRVTTGTGETVTLLDGPALLAAARRSWNRERHPGRSRRSLTMRRRTVLRLLSSALLPGALGPVAVARAADVAAAAPTRWIPPVDHRRQCSRRFCQGHPRSG